MDVSPAHTTVSSICTGRFEIQERTRLAKDKLERYSQERSTKIETHVRKGRGK